MEQYLNKVVLGDCLEAMKNMPDSCVDLIVTDPPYSIGFMGKEWDKALPSVEVWKECLRVLKPGAFAFVMSSTRQDCLARMIINLEDAGFRVNFTSIYWTYATGFPKAANLSKLADKRAGVERAVVGKKQGTYADIKRNKETGQDGLHGGIAKDRQRVECLITAPATPEAKALDGAYAGFQPKPALECILVAMRPLSEKTYLGQALKCLSEKACVVCGFDEWEAGNETTRLDCGCYMCDECLLSGEAVDHECQPHKTGLGGTWLDAGRIPIERSDDIHAKNPHTVGYIGKYGIYGKSEPIEYQVPQGRFSPNLLVSGNALDTGEITKSGVTIQPVFESKNVQGFQPNPRAIPGYNQHADSGGFSRYFSLDAWAKKYLPEDIDKTFPFLCIPKPSKSQKDAGLNECYQLKVGAPVEIQEQIKQFLEKH